MSQTVFSISADGFHSCAVKTDGTQVCRGNDKFGEARPPKPAMTKRPSLSAPGWVAGETVTADQGEWSNAPEGYAYL